MYTDKFFQARGDHTAGRSTPYLQDLHSTLYKLPAPRSGSYEKALAFRQHEKASVEAIVNENEILRTEFTALAKRATQELRKQKQLIGELNSKLKASDVAGTSRDRGSGNNGKHPVQSVEERSEGCAADVPGEVLRTPVPDSRGQANEHVDEGRQTVGAGGSTGGVAVPIRDGDGDPSADAKSGVPSE
jgi:hypothetical protein